MLLAILFAIFVKKNIKRFGIYYFIDYLCKIKQRE